MFVTNDLGKSFAILELSLSAQLKGLALTVEGMETEEEKEQASLLACRIISSRFTAFTPEEVMHYIWWHRAKLRLDRLEQELCEITSASQEEIDRLDQIRHQLTTALAQAENDADYWRKMHVIGSQQPKRDYDDRANT